MAVTKFLARDLVIEVESAEVVGAVANLTTPFGEADTELLTDAAHGLVAGDRIRFTALTGGAGLTVGTDYYVIATGLTANDFKVSLIQGGTAVDFTTDLTAGSYTKITSTWVHIGGLQSLSHKPATERADATDMDSNGRSENIVVQRGDTWTLSGHNLEDVATGTRDPGQAAVEALGLAVGLAGTGVFRLTSPGGNTSVFDATVEVTFAGGGHNDLATWAADLEVSGAVIFTPSP